MTRLLFVFALFISIAASAQGHLALSGMVADENGHPLKSATVFISGSQKITITDENGRFLFQNVEPGTFQLSATMLGYDPIIQNVILKENTAPVTLVLKVKSIILNQVNIGNNDKWEVYYRVFKEQFLGSSLNASECTILNPRVLSLNFNNKTGLLTAEADKFLFIDNKRLGYRIRYLLKDFQYSLAKNTAIYDGETIFEELEGTKKMQSQWAKARADTYKGSLMHFLRSVYGNRSLKEGFITNLLYNYVTKPDAFDNDPRLSIDARPARFDTLVTVVDSSFIALKFRQMYVTYDPKAAALVKVDNPVPIKKTVSLADNGSIIKLSFDEAIIDRKGSYTNYRAFFIRGNMAANRIGDILPFEYQPPTVLN